MAVKKIGAVVEAKKLNQVYELESNL